MATIYVFIFIEFIGVTLVNRIIQVSGVRFYNISLYCVFTTTSQVSSHHHLSLFTSLLPQSITTLLSMPMSSFFLFFSFLLNLSTPPNPAPPPQTAVSRLSWRNVTLPRIMITDEIIMLLFSFAFISLYN